MATITLKGNPISTSGELPAVGSKAPGFTLTAADLSDLTLQDLAGQKAILNIFPSLDTGICAMSVRRFNEEAAKLDGTVIVNVSADLPFAQKRFCGAEGIERAKVGSTFRSSFARDYGAEITEGPMRGLCVRAVIVLDESGTVRYTQLVPEIVQEPDYDAALAAL
ncbi:MAG: thiol peroxidase [Deltaproteobacteria bacterium]|nr:thiol peroxidase [Deltaproteobacteria bacterium]